MVKKTKIKNFVEESHNKVIRDKLKISFEFIDTEMMNSEFYSQVA